MVELAELLFGACAIAVPIPMIPATKGRMVCFIFCMMFPIIMRAQVSALFFVERRFLTGKKIRMVRFSNSFLRFHFIDYFNETVSRKVKDGILVQLCTSAYSGLLRNS